MSSRARPVQDAGLTEGRPLERLLQIRVQGRVGVTGKT